MGNKNEIRCVGDPKVTTYQIAIIVIGVFLVLFSGFIAIVTNNQYYRYFPLIIFIFFSITLIFYSKLYNVNYDRQKFYVSNLFIKKTIEKDKFIGIRKVAFIDFLQLVVFEDDKFLVLKTSNNYFKNIFKSPDLAVNEQTLEIRKFISNHERS